MKNELREFTYNVCMLVCIQYWKRKKHSIEVN